MAKHHFTEEDDRHYISLLQENINRMASNSANCKTWLVTILAALLAIQVSLQELQGILWIALVPAILFYILDSYYLGLERRFIKIEGNFVEHEKTDDTLFLLLYNFNTKAIMGDWKATWLAMGSASTFPFYITVIIIILVVSAWPCISSLICK